MNETSYTCSLPHHSIIKGMFQAVTNFNDFKIIFLSPNLLLGNVVDDTKVLLRLRMKRWENLNYSFVKTDFKFQIIKRQAALVTITKVVMLAGK